MAKKNVLADDMAAINAARKAMGNVTAKQAIEKAAAIGTVATASGMQRDLMTLAWAYGHANKGKVDFKPVFAAWKGRYYDQSLVNPRKVPKAASLTNQCSTYQSFANLGALPYDTWPIASRVMAERNLSVTQRKPKIDKMIENHATTAPSADEIAALFTVKAEANRGPNIDAALKAICSLIDRFGNDVGKMAALKADVTKSELFRTLATDATKLRMAVTKEDGREKAEKSNKALLAKLASLPSHGKRNGAAVH